MIMRTAALPVALMAAALSGTAQADSTSTSVTLYGIADVYGEALQGAARTARLQSGGLSGSRFGLRGSEDLGGGMSAVFTLESGINLDDGTYGQGAFWGRQAYVGLRSSMGQITLGRQYGSLFTIGSDFSEFSNTAVGASTALIGGFGGYEPLRGSSDSGTGNGGPARINNAIKVETASLSGFKVGALVGLGEVAGGTSGTRVVDVHVRYSATQWGAMVSAVSDRAAATGLDVRTVSAAAWYALGDWRAMGGLVSVNDRSVSNDDGRGWWLGGDYHWGRHTVRAQYVVNEDRGDTPGKSRALGAGYQYDLSRRTSLYAALTRFTNDGAGYADRWAGAAVPGLTSATDRDITQTAAGIRHSF